MKYKLTLILLFIITYYQSHGQSCTGITFAIEALTVTDVSCYGGTNGAAQVKIRTNALAGWVQVSITPYNTVSYAGSVNNGNGTVTHTYNIISYVNPATNNLGLIAGQYTLHTNIVSPLSQFCHAVNTPINIKQPQALTATAGAFNNESCSYANNGNVEVIANDGTEPYSYNWGPGNPAGDGTERITNLNTGTYTCTVTDANGCTASYSKSIAEPPAIDFSLISLSNVSCFGGNNGSIKINHATGGPANTAPTYQWTRAGAPAVVIPATINQSGVSINNLVADTYTCLVTIGSCTESRSFVVSQPTALTAAINFTNITCPGLTNGTATIIASGGTSPYTYNWNVDTFVGQSMLNNLPAATYICTVTDQDGCTASNTATVTAPAAFASSFFKTRTQCEYPSATAIATITGGTSPYSFAWQGLASTTATANNLAAGNYTITVTDHNNCIQITSVTITALTPLPNYNPTVINAACFGTNTGSVLLQLPEGIGSKIMSVNWYDAQNNIVTQTGINLGGETDAGMHNVLAGNYRLVLNGQSTFGYCNKTIYVTITEPAAIPAPTSPTASTTVINGLLSISLSASGCAGDLVWKNNIDNSILLNSTPTVSGGENFQVLCQVGQCQSDYSTDAVQIYTNDACNNSISITSDTGVLITNFPLQTMANSSKTLAGGGIDNIAHCQLINSSNAKDIWYSLAVSDETGSAIGINITPTHGSTGNLMGAALYDGCNGAQLACASNNGSSSNGAVYLTYNNTPPNNSRVAAPQAQTLLLRVWEFNPADPNNFTPTATFLISSTLTPLPVTLISFTGKITNQGNQLTWKTASEKGFSHFEVEKSTDALKFVKLGIVKGSSSETYQFTDKQPQTSIQYYRLRMVDLDGTADFSKIITLSSTPDSDVQVYPNPAKNRIYLSNISENEPVTLYNTIGGKISSNHYSIVSGIDISAITTGYFFIKTKNKTLKALKIN
jgi:hypothetical protein